MNEHEKQRTNGTLEMKARRKIFFSDIPLSKDRAKDALGDKDLVVTDGGGTF